ncbi:hypothetical protein GCM10023261_09980 [Bartonella jaculi]|uniref:Uncharacterized protein n=1 Tax=Bartonella jaculi TaxID=686226 RepID=A0ABP9N948_9HYPH
MKLRPQLYCEGKAQFFILGAMPKNVDGHPVLSLLITHGWAQLGFLKLGRLAPL